MQIQSHCYPSQLQSSNGFVLSLVPFWLVSVFRHLRHSLSFSVHGSSWQRCGQTIHIFRTSVCQAIYNHWSNGYYVHSLYNTYHWYVSWPFDLLVLVWSWSRGSGYPSSLYDECIPLLVLQ